MTEGEWEDPPAIGELGQDRGRDPPQSSVRKRSRATTALGASTTRLKSGLRSGSGSILHCRSLQGERSGRSGGAGGRDENTRNNGDSGNIGYNGEDGDDGGGGMKVSEN